MSKHYRDFMIRYQKFKLILMGRRILNKNMQKKFCHSCIFQKDEHQMNCIECCPIMRSIKKRSSKTIKEG